VHKAAVRAYEQFQEEYSAAWRLWINDVRSVFFPYGTWGMRVVHRANVEAAPPPPS
jgi:hypothetical protein